MVSDSSVSLSCRAKVRLDVSATTSASEPPRLGWTMAKVLIVLLVVLAAGIALGTGLGITIQRSPVQPTINSPVTVFGSLKSTGANTAPSSVVFAGASGGPWTAIAGLEAGSLPSSIYQGTVSGYFNPGYYSIQIPNHANYTVNVIWVGSFGWQGGTVSKGSIRVDVGIGNTFHLDLSADTPDSWVGVSGSVSTGQIAPGATPLNVTFLSEKFGAVGYIGPRPLSDRGGRFSAQVYAGNQYSLNVPNDDRYDIAVQWTGPNGTTGTCYVATFIGIGVVTIVVNVGGGGAYYSYNAICNF
jgi:hypothetical protein